MPEQLTAEHFDETMRSIADTLGDHGGQLAAINMRLDKIDTRLGAIEAMLWQGQRLEQMAERIFALAEATGHPELAQPFVASPGLASSLASET